MIEKTMLRKICVLFFLVSFVALMGKGWHWAKDGFSFQRTRFPLGPLEAAHPDSEVRDALNQTYSYLGRGHQCYAFESADKKFVLKLPRYDRYVLPFWLRACQFSFLEEKRKNLRLDKEHRLRFLLNSFQIAYEELNEETALIYLHLNETNAFQSKTKIIDRIRRGYWIDLDSSAFILQKKKPLMMPAFQKSLKAKDQTAAKEILNAFLDVIAIRAKKGIFNKDPSFLRNFGYDEKGVQIDIGSFYRKPGIDGEIAFKPSFLQTVGHVQDWLNGVDPEIAVWFKTRTDEIAAQSKTGELKW